MKVHLPLRVFLIISALWLTAFPTYAFFQNATSKAKNKTKYEFTDTRISEADTLLKKREYESALEAYQKAYDTYEAEKFYEGMVYAKERGALCMRALRRVRESKGEYREAIGITQKHLGKNHFLLAKLYAETGRRAHHAREPVEASRFLDTAMMIYKKASEFDSVVYKRIVDYKFYSYYVSNQSIDTITKYLNLRGEIQESVAFDASSRLKLLNDYSRAFLQSGDFQKAMSYSIEAQKLGSEYLSIDAKDYSTALFNLGRSFYSQGEYQRALDVTNELIEYTLEKLPNNVELLAYYNLRAISLSGMEKFDLAAREFHNLIDILEKRGRRDRFYRTTLMNLGVCYELMGDLRQSQEYLYQALEEERASDSLININYVDRYRYLGQFFSTKLNFDQAVLYYDSALRSGIPSYREELFSFPKDSLLRPTFNVLTILKNKVISLNSLNASLVRDSVEILESSVKYVNRTHDYLMKNRESLQASQGKLFLSEDFKSLYTAGIEACYLLYNLGIKTDYYFEQALRFSGFSKSLLFLEQSGELGSVQNSSLNSETKQTFFKLKTEIDQLESKFYDITVENIRSDSIRKINSVLLKLNSSFKLLRDSLERQSKNFKVRYSHETFNLQRLLNYVDKNSKSAILEYFLTASDIYVFGLAKDKKLFVKKERDENFKESFEKVIKEISIKPDINEYNESIFSFKKNSHVLYKYLIKDVLSSLHQEVNSLTIIPDEELSRLPYEILIQEVIEGEEFFYEFSYMLKNFDINYLLSSQQVGLEKKNKQASKGLLGIGFSGNNIADERNGKNVFKDLPGTEDEIKFLKSRIKGDYFLGLDGSKSKFLSEARNYDILHLAIHGKSNVANRYESSLVFNGSDNILKTSDLYVADLKSRIAVLSACESGIGEINKGEGAFSIARGFALVGVPSVVMSLWSVNDKMTAEIMAEMYSEFEEGRTLSTALSLSKRSYLNSSDKYTSHPYYWSAFVSLGDEVYLKESKSYDLKVIIVLPLLLLIIALFGSIRKKKRGSITP